MPDGHASQEIEAAPEYLPAAHARQSDTALCSESEAPSSELYVPAGQSVQPAAAVKLNVPAEQGAHTDDPREPAKVPPEQAVQPVDPLVVET